MLKRQTQTDQSCLDQNCIMCTMIEKIDLDLYEDEVRRLRERLAIGARSIMYASGIGPEDEWGSKREFRESFRTYMIVEKGIDPADPRTTETTLEEIMELCEKE